MKTTANWLLSFALLLCALNAWAAPLHTRIAYDTITGNVVSGGGDWFGYSPGVGTYVVGDQFTPTATGYISSLEAAMYFAGAGGPLTLGVYADNGGRIGTFLENLIVEASTWDFPNPGPYACGSYATGVTLHAGQPYWVVTPNISPFAYWEDMAMPGSFPLTTLTQPGALYLNLIPGPVGSLTGGSDEYFSPGSGVGAKGLKVIVAHPVPSPGTGWLLLTGLTALIFFRRRPLRAIGVQL